MSSIKRGEIWVVNFDPTVGAEIKKTRPAVVVSSNAIGTLPVKLIAPITEWKERSANNLWHVKIIASPSNGLSKDSAVDTLQLRGVDTSRFVRKLGMVSATELKLITAAIAAVVEWEA